MCVCADGEKPVRAGNEPGELGQTRRRLIDFLQTSDFYEPERLLTHFSDNCELVLKYTIQDSPVDTLFMFTVLTQLIQSSHLRCWGLDVGGPVAWNSLPDNICDL